MRRRIPPRSCECCRQTYVPVSASQKFCSQTCAYKMKKNYTPEKQVEMLKDFYGGEVFVLDESTWQWHPLTEAEKQQRLNQELEKLNFPNKQTN